MRVSVIGLVGLVGLNLVTVAAQAPPLSREEARKLKNPVEATEESIAGGRQIFTRLCSSCHGPAGKGDGGGRMEGSPKPANLVDEKWDHGDTDGEIFLTIRDGVGPDLFMEPWGDRLKEPDIWNVVNYIRSLRPKSP